MQMINAISFDMSINLGTVLTVAGFIFASGRFAGRVIGALARIESIAADVKALGERVMRMEENRAAE